MRSFIVTNSLSLDLHVFSNDIAVIISAMMMKHGQGAARDGHLPTGLSRSSTDLGGFSTSVNIYNTPVPVGRHEKSKSKSSHGLSHFCKASCDSEKYSS
ncbi:hypothetical protein Y032_0362g3517 [Ancylostoma ceylanicum]|uniref:Uncharacterized protein n=1 Tax=Ancylostoma ceylanicum TaxID=53326 RepID=A0A016RVC7_9BILA|nr:hypothetical protein Y032_0362g3517 [Ancylostoma ceylanicum]